ncbi:MAG: DUF551 domain-containing protein [Oscillospiraceae bacterium]|nr:DUF551 domain-containing protein [Oscillospiraceae bacterium]
MSDIRKDCPMRHENGNCLVAGGFCTAVNDPICEALHNAYYCGYRNGVTVQKWIPVSERLPDEHDSIFAKLYGTEKWTPNMFRKVSDTVPVVIEYADGQKSVVYMRAHDGEWDLNPIWQAKVTHWMLKPEPPKE